MGVHAQVYRCGNTYTQEPCKGGREVDVTPPVSDLSGPKTTVIYLCRAQGGSFYWIPQRCATRGWTLERSATVSKHVSWENQVVQKPTSNETKQRSSCVGPFPCTTQLHKHKCLSNLL